ncbi:hypothetical protein BC835DRAFT_1529012 [Cytidiella melzeri]|nr:hypothetical protein BC835DRAFT_1529012 [Cytidiella melzeri]
MRIVGLPDDILLQVVLYLSIQDVLSFKQTCRVLHAFGSTDYLWHRLAERSDLLLNISSNTVITELPADELQRVVIDAIRLELNWRRSSPRIKRTMSLNIANDALFEHLHFVNGGKWLLVVQGHPRRFEERVYTQIYFWDLHVLNEPRCVIRFELIGKHRASAVTLHDQEESATLVVALNDASADFFEVRTFSLTGEFTTLSHVGALPSVAKRIELPPSSGPLRAISVTSVSVCGHVLAATVVIFAPDQAATSHIVVARTDNGSAHWMQREPYKPIHSALTRLHRNNIIIFGHNTEGYACHVYELPPSLLYPCSRSHMSLSDCDFPDNLLEWGPLVAHSTCVMDKLFNLFPEPSTIPSASGEILAFMLMAESCAYLMRFHLSARTTSSSSGKRFVRPITVKIRADTSVRLVGVGISGRRAVWMEHNLETTRSQLMKLEALQDDTTDGEYTQISSGVLLPPDPPLPFSTDACQGLAFDEASGRLCIGLWGGSLYLVDFS